MSPSDACPGRRLADRFCQAAAHCTAIGDLDELVRSAASELEFDFYALLHHDSLVEPSSPLIRFDNYPADWTAELLATGLYAEDPVHRASRRAGSAFRWIDLHRLTALGPGQRRILERSREFGIGEGLTVPVNVPGEPAGSCSFAMRAGQSIGAQVFSCAELVGLHAFEAARRLVQRAAPRPRPRLSNREVECLRLVAIGKTDWEIGVILGISVETARHYVKRARAAYGVSTRTQLALQGLRDDWLAFSDLPAGWDGGEA